MSECPTLETDRLHLRPFVDDDVEAYFALYDTPEVRRSLHVADSFSATMPGPTLPCGEANGRCAARAGGRSSVETPGRLSDEQARTFPNEPVGRVWRSAGHSTPTTGATATPPRPAGQPSTGCSKPRRRRARERDPAREHRKPGRGSPPRLRVVRGADPAHFPQQPHGIWRLTRPATSDDPSAFGQ